MSMHRFLTERREIFAPSTPFSYYLNKNNMNQLCIYEMNVFLAPHEIARCGKKL